MQELYRVPLQAPKTIEQRMEHFDPAIYNVGPGSHLRNLVEVLCGDAGAGDLKKKLLLVRLQQTLVATNFFDLDKFFGDIFRFPRLSSEIYPYNPYEDYLTTVEWDEIKVKDAVYRSRIKVFMRSLMAGTTRDGVALRAEAALGIPCQVVENYEYIDGGAINQNQTLGRLTGSASSREEITVIPSTLSITPQEERRALHALDKCSLPNRIYTVSMMGVVVHTELNMRDKSACSSEYIKVTRVVTGDTSWPFANQGKNWIEAGDGRDVRYQAFMGTRVWQSDMYAQVDNVVPSSIHVGSFNQFQEILFAHIPHVEPSTTFSAFQGQYALMRSPINISTPWVVR